MIQIQFYLKSEKPDKHGNITLIASIYCNYKAYRMKLGKVRIRDWNKKSQRLRLSSQNTKEYEENTKMNGFIDEVESKAKSLFQKAAMEKRKPSEFELLNLMVVPEQPTVRESASVMEVFKDFIESNKPDKADRTITGYTTVRNFIIRFQKSTKYILTWDNIDVNFLDKLKRFTFITEKLQTGYYAKITRVLSTFLGWAEERNYGQFTIYDKLQVAEPEKEVLFLDMDDLSVLLYYNFKSDRLSKARYLFCFAAVTGLRYSDVVSVKREHIHDRILYKTQVKTTDVNTVPLNDFAIEILKKYENDERPLPKISSQKINEYIKECCKIIASEQQSNTGFNRRVIKKIVIGSKTTEISLPLHEAITFHVSRKTFITNSIMLGMNIKALQDMGAPKKDKDLKKYLKITDAYKNQVMDQTWNLLTFKQNEVASQK